MPTPDPKSPKSSTPTETLEKLQKAIRKTQIKFSPFNPTQFYDFPNSVQKQCGYCDKPFFISEGMEHRGAQVRKDFCDKCLREFKKAGLKPFKPKVRLK